MIEKTQGIKFKIKKSLNIDNDSQKKKNVKVYDENYWV